MKKGVMGRIVFCCLFLIMTVSGTAAEAAGGKTSYEEPKRPVHGETEKEQKKMPEKQVTGEDLFEYEIKTGDDGSRYAVIKGFREKYRDDFVKGLQSVADSSWRIVFPERLEGVCVTELAAGAFQNVPLCEYSDGMEISSCIASIGASCFENCGLKDVFFREGDPEEESFQPLSIGDGAFAGNPELWGIYLGNCEIGFGSGVFENCAEKVYLCYMRQPEEMIGTLKAYGLENGLYVVEIPEGYSDKPMVDYPEAPLVLEPEVRNFFYGENAPDEKFCSFAYDDNALDYGFPEWHIPCGEFCAMPEYVCDRSASSELPSQDGKYGVNNLGSSWGRELAWAEGVEGYGIGESISITQCFGYHYWSDPYQAGGISFLDGDIEPDIYDGYMRYTEVCIVNGYAKDQKVWEENGRVKRLLMYVEDRPYAYLELEDTMRPQYFALPVDGIKVADGAEIHFRFVIEEVYEGTKYEDTCLTGLVVEFMGRRGH